MQPVQLLQKFLEEKPEKKRQKNQEKEEPERRINKKDV